MSTEIIKTMVIWAVSDTEFRDLLFDDPDKALAEYDLSDEEVASLKGMQRDKFDANAGELEERISRAGLDFGLTIGTDQLADGSRTYEPLVFTKRIDGATP